MRNLDWYHSLHLPSLTPPDYVFTYAWVVLYIMIFVSFFIFINKNSHRHKGVATIFFIIQMVLNFFWSSIFFSTKDIEGGLVIIILIWIVLAITIFEFYKISKLAAILLIPYYIWISFALYLNTMIVILNK